MSTILRYLYRKTSKTQKMNEVVPQSEWQKTNLFALITYGGTATSWISKVLNHHPEIFCVHELAIVLDQSKLFSSNDFWDKFDPIDYMKIVARTSHHEVKGDVHSFRPKDIPQLKEYFGKNFSSVVIEREPISRLKSMMVMHNSNISKGYKFYDMRFIDYTILRKKKIHLPESNYKNKLFVKSVNALNNIEEEVNYNCGKMFRMEDLISDTKYLKSLIEEISSGRLNRDDDYADDLLNKMIKTPPTNLRASKEKIEFEDWQIDVIKKVVSDKSWELYSELGYTKPNFL